MLMKIKIGITVERILAISNVTTCSFTSLSQDP